MTPILALLVAAPFLVFDPGFFSAFQFPKLTAIAIAVLIGSIHVVRNRECRVPGNRRTLFIAACVLSAAMLGMRGPTPWTAAVEPVTLVLCITGWLVVANLPAQGSRGVMIGILAASVIESLVAIAHVIHPLGILRPFDDSVRPAAIGTVGNPEFLATLLAAGLCMAWRLRGQVRDRWLRLLIVSSVAPLLVALVLTRSKGTVALLALALLYGWKGWKPVAVITGVAAVAAPILFPDSVLGRVMLWAATRKVLLDGLPFGSGFEGLTHRYLDAVCTLFTDHPALSDRLGTYVGDVRDAHNLIIDQGVAVGIAGVVLAVAFMGHVVRRAVATGGSVGAAILILAAKMMYTVVLGSVTGAWLLALLLALVPDRREWRRIRINAPLRIVSPVAVVAVILFCVPALNADRMFQRGTRALQAGDESTARACFESSLRSNPGHAESALSLAFVEYLKKDRGVMKEWIGRAIALEPTIDIVKRGAHMFFFSRMYADAEPLYRRLMLAYPDRRSAIIKLAQVRLARGDRKEAESLARRVIVMQPRVYNFNDSEYVRTARDLLAGLHPHRVDRDGQSAILKSTLNP